MRREKPNAPKKPLGGMTPEITADPNTIEGLTINPAFQVIDGKIVVWVRGDDGKYTKSRDDVGSAHTHIVVEDITDDELNTIWSE